MAIINDTYKYVFLAEPHTGSRAVTEALHKDHESRRAGSHHESLKALIDKRYLRPQIAKDYTVFNVCRNPADILVTKWLKATGGAGVKFSEYIRQLVPPNTQSGKLLFRHRDVVHLTFKYEDGLDAINSWFDTCGWKRVTFPVIGKTARKKPWPNYYTLADLKYVLEHYSEVHMAGYAETLTQRIHMLETAEPDTDMIEASLEDYRQGKCRSIDDFTKELKQNG